MSETPETPEAVWDGSPYQVPVQYGIGAATSSTGAEFIVMRFVTPVGMSQYFFDRPSGANFHRLLSQTLRMPVAGAGLVLPPNGFTLPQFPKGK